MSTQIAKDVGDMKNDQLLKERLDPLHQDNMKDGCMHGTRVRLLKEVDEWLRDGEGSNILWISGSPGAGKTAFSSTIVSSLLKGTSARFFSKKKVAGHGEPRMLWRTIAYELAMTFTIMKKPIVEILKSKGSRTYASDSGVKDQFNGLIKGLFQDPDAMRLSSLSTYPVVVVIDALDEFSKGNHRDWNELLSTLCEWSSLPRAWRLIITSRDEPEIEEKLRHISHHMVLTSGGSVTEDSNTDIRFFFNRRFEDVKFLDSSGPSSEDIENLTLHAAGLFHWAVTAVDFVCWPGGDADLRLKTLLENMKKNPNVQNTDILYGQILLQVFSQLLPDERKTKRRVLAAIILGKDALHIQDVVDLLGSAGRGPIDEMRSKVEKAIASLRPLITIREGDQLLDVCHILFSDFVLDETRVCKAIKNIVKDSDFKDLEDTDHDFKSYALSRSKHSALFVQACLRLMNGTLAFNICNIETSHVANEAIPKLDLRVAQNIRRSLRYACRHWADHLADVIEHEPVVLEIRPLLKEFLYKHILHWVEVLALKGSIRYAAPSLMLAAIHTETVDKDLSNIARDAGRFVTAFEPAIALSVPHIYISALAFAPVNSQISKIIGPKYGNALSVLSGRRADWDQRLMTLQEHQGQVSCVSFSADGGYFASGSVDKTVRVWDSHSGGLVGDPISGHIDEVLALAFTSDGSRLISGCRDGSLWVWDLKTRKRLEGPINAHAFKISSLISFKEKLASAACDGIIQIWDVTKDGIRQSGNGPLKKHDGAVYSVTFSPAGHHLVSGSLDRSMMIWDVRSGDVLHTISRAHEQPVSSVAYSLNGDQIVSGSDDCTIRLWDSEGNPLKTISSPQHLYPITSVAFSPDGESVVSGSLDKTIRFWDVRSGEAIGEPLVHSSPVHCVAFSPHRIIVVSGHENSSICIWDARTNNTNDVHRLQQGHDSDVLSVAFDTNSNQLVSGSKDGYVRVWDVHVGNCLVAWRASTSNVSSVKFVPKSDCVVAGTDDGTIFMLNFKTREILNAICSQQKDIRTVVICPEGKYVASGSRDHSIMLWEFQSINCRQVGVFVGHVDKVLTMAFSPCGKIIASGSDDTTVMFWRVDAAHDGKEVECFETLRHHKEAVLSVSFSPNGRQLASGCFDGTIGIWDMESKSLTFYGKAHDLSVNCIAYSPGGEVIVTGSEDKKMKFWNAGTGDSIGQPLEGHVAPIWAIKIAPDGKSIASGSADATIKIWDVIQKEGVPVALNEEEIEDAASVFRVSFNKETGCRHLGSSEGGDVDLQGALQSTNHFAFFDAEGDPVLGDGSYIDEDGWVRNRTGKGEGEDDPLLFWLPPANRAGFWWPRNRAVMARLITRVDTSQFMHGNKWINCRTETV
ncbi:WD40 repeat-like protein [Schizopora paradoxa]|uniref:WD40 repeat-like protein n=1 Tax=Schizopora paradoxa TaxID=27342 RepID=A0A0H2RNE5_9AGAM|nr:WD40 repeat-like protein [Schizopora paradoxa]